MAESDTPLPSEGRCRAVVEHVRPEIDGGRYPIKRTVGDAVVVEADCYTDGHDRISCVVRWRQAGQSRWQEAPLEPIGNDRWRASFEVEALGVYEYTVRAWVDHFKTWRHDLVKRIEAGQDIETDLEIGARLIRQAAERARRKADTAALEQAAEAITDESVEQAVRGQKALDEPLAERMAAWPDLSHATTYDRTLEVRVDPELARFSSWYELFPRSTADEPGRHGTFADVEDRLDYVAKMGFDVLYFPPIHPIGHTHRKGKNNARVAAKGDVGSPWAIGSEQGGHKAIHPALGDLDDFKRLVELARHEYGIEIALDIAFQASPDHPWVRKHPEFFKHRPDGSIQYAENPPKKYEDIYPINFETEAWPELWRELESVFRYWCEQGVTVFRVDNPHTKAFDFWQWCIASIKADFPETIFLSEAFTRPKVMKKLAKLGFSQSYTYFAWRHGRHEFEAYLEELTKTEVWEYMRPNFWPNTPDILTEALQTGRRSVFVTRLVLAGTMAASWGIYGPAFELMEHTAREEGSEEYLHSEKYQLRHWDLDDPDSLAPIIGRLNRIRRDNPALQRNRSIHFHPVNNDRIIAYTKHTPQRDNIILTVVNLDWDHTQAGTVWLDLGQLAIPSDASFTVEDLLNDATYTWHGAANYVELDPERAPAHIFRIARRRA